MQEVRNVFWKNFAQRRKGVKAPKQTEDQTRNFALRVASAPLRLCAKFFRKVSSTILVERRHESEGLHGCHLAVDQV